MIWLLIPLGCAAYLFLLLFVAGVCGLNTRRTVAETKAAVAETSDKLDRLVEVLAAPTDVAEILAAMNPGELADLATQVRERKRGR